MPTSGGRKWDQFASNEAKFGLTTDYAEELYTTELDARWADRAEGEAGGAEAGGCAVSCGVVSCGGSTRGGRRARSISGAAPGLLLSARRRRGSAP
jgi:hypothetical protein